MSDELAAQRPASQRAGALAGALLAIVTLLFMVTGRHVQIPAANEPATGGQADAAGTHMVTIDGLSFVDQQRGFALVSTCVPGGADCVHALAATTDGGRTWRSSAIPWGPADDSSDSARLYVFDAHRLVLDADQDGHRRWRSADAGLTWQAVADPGNRKVAAAPAGSMVVVEDPDYWGGAGGPLFALSPNGTGHWLAHQPADMDDLDGDPTTGPDGTVWLTGGRNGAAQWVAVTRDRGRTWRRWTSPAIATGACLLAVPGGSAYLGCVGDSAPAVYRSTDGGRTWRAMAAPAGWSTLAVAGSAPLCTGEKGTVYRLSGGGAFAAVAAAPLATALASAGTYAVLVAGGGTALHYFVSSDGAAWREITPAA